MEENIYGSGTGNEDDEAMISMAFVDDLATVLGGHGVQVSVYYVREKHIVHGYRSLGERPNHAPYFTGFVVHIIGDRMLTQPTHSLTGM